ncbi:hypothetical protein GGX14DRAFT_383747 [Mycena pura]|uniref:No apical meristem-associated C-terminal domain-containing protein n=1 Tax=Mycena pura TaxID=153505 RepID=A0AAD6YU02_9AGAR|nr:hypothetical protein GGX14DRAFT_383747 [Mycena pura]
MDYRHQVYNFPPLDTSQFYAHPQLPPPPAPYGNPYPTFVGSPTPEASAGSFQGINSSPSPPAAPVKRGRGRPPNPETVKRRAAVNSAAKAVAKATKPKSPKKNFKKKPTRSRKADKENVPLPSEDPINISDSEDETEYGTKSHWSAIERSQFYRFLLGPGAAGDRRFEQHKTDPTHVYRRAEELLFSGTRSVKAIRSLWKRSMDTFQWMLVFESYTGNGGVDPDSDDPVVILKSRLAGARTAGLTLGSLRPETINEWRANGWWDLFNDRLGQSAKVTRETVRNSASALSDQEDNDTVNQDSDNNIDPHLLEESRAAQTTGALNTPAPCKPASATVSEPKHTPASRFRTHSFGNMGDFIKLKMESEEKKTKAYEAKLELDQAKFQLERERAALDEKKAKADMARMVMSTDGMTDEVKAAANNFLLNLFK